MEGRRRALGGDQHDTAELRPRLVHEIAAYRLGVDYGSQPRTHVEGKLPQLILRVKSSV